MSRYLRTAGLCGVALGLILDVGILILYPLFFSSLVELLALPLAFGLLGVVLGGLLGLLRSGAGSSGPRRSRMVRIVVALVVLCVAGYALRAPARNWTVAPKVLLVGFDGASWNLLDPLMEAGELPAIKSLTETGAAGNLQSFEPLYSPILWTTIATGVVPERHGITSFFATQDRLKAPRIWEIASDQGQTVGVFRWWAAWPPRPVNGFLIPGILAADSQTHPPEYSFVNQLRIDRKAGHKIGLGGYLEVGLEYLRCGLRFVDARAIGSDLFHAWRSRDRRVAHAAQRWAEIRLNAAVYGHLLRRFEPDYTSFYDNGIDVLAHHYWRFFEPEKFPDVTPEEAALYGDFIPEHVRLSDQVLGELLAHVDPSTAVLVVSDHGLEASDEGISRAPVPEVPVILEDLGVEGSFYSINLANRSFIESTIADHAKLEQAVQELAERLRAIQVVETGQPIFNPAISKAGDRIELLVLVDREGTGQLLDFEGRQVPLEKWVRHRDVKSGTHHPVGIILARGPMIRPGGEFDGATLLDVAPTALYLIGAPVARDLDGRILTEVIDDGYLERRPVRWVESYPRQEAVETDIELNDDTIDALRSLGYVN